jgi:hypothetical protein
MTCHPVPGSSSDPENPPPPEAVLPMWRVEQENGKLVTRSQAKRITPLSTAPAVAQTIERAVAARTEQAQGGSGKTE